IATASVSTSGGLTRAAITTGMLGAGTHTITASYNGDGIFSSSSNTLTQTVNKAATKVTVGSSPNPSTSGQVVTFTATVSVSTPGSTQAGYPAGSVTFRDGSASIGQGTLNTSSGVTTAIF